MFVDGGAERKLYLPENIFNWDEHDPAEPTYWDDSKDTGVTLKQVERSLFDSTFVRPKPVTILDLPVVITKLIVQYEELEQFETTLPFANYPYPTMNGEGLILPTFGNNKTIVKVRMSFMRDIETGEIDAIFVQRIRPPGEPRPNIVS